MSVNITASDLSKEFKARRLRRSLLRTLLKSHPNREENFILHPLSFTVSQGEILGVVGGNGSGKSTLLRLVAGILSPTSGSISTAKSMSALLSPYGFWFEELSTFENVRFLSAFYGYCADDFESRAEELFEFAGASTHRDSPASTLTSGMRARLMLSLALNSGTEILLLDEALGTLDEEYRNRTIQTLKDRRSRNHSVVIVSHELSVIESLADSVLILSNGRMVAHGPAERTVRQYQSSSLVR